MIFRATIPSSGLMTALSPGEGDVSTWGNSDGAKPRLGAQTGFSLSRMLAAALTKVPRRRAINMVMPGAHLNGGRQAPASTFTHKVSPDPGTL